ncbi:unnamed protein product [Caenorhabditis angaria]|uniref:Uncharacterized protein n=1 Tax=Caenorhabditis angaria TaxID=860376 RepID=A0A9P1N829_9PELO|nr:unnamed protein product [Caenorhabditis angaria]
MSAILSTMEIFFLTLVSFAAIFDVYLLLAVYNNRKDSFRFDYGHEISLITNLSYLLTHPICLLMTINRLFIIICPFRTRIFSQTRIFIYCFIISSLFFIIMYIPYISECPLNFQESRLEFISDCFPGQHWITNLQSKYLLILPLTSMIINLSVVVHMKAIRQGFYNRYIVNKKKNSTSSITLSVGISTNKQENRMIRQTFSITIYLSFYSIVSLAIRTFPTRYSELSADFKCFIMLFRLLLGCFVNTIVYYFETTSTRVMIRNFPEKAKKKKSFVSIVEPTALQPI